MRPAKEALVAGNYQLAENKLSMVPAESITADILLDLNTQKATMYLGKGKYLEADLLYAELEQTDQLVALRQQLFVESRALQCALIERKSLLYPDSIEIVELAVSTNNFSKDYDNSTDILEIRTPHQPEFLLHYRAKTKAGNMSDGFVMFVWENGGYEGGVTVNELDIDKDPPSYLSDKEQLEYKRDRAWINLWLWGAIDLFDETQLARLNAAVKNVSINQVELMVCPQSLYQPVS